MKDFFKRLKWRLAGGIVTMGLGAFAAAQVQREGFIDEQPLPSLDSPAWAASLPVPIQAGPEQNWNTQSEVLPASFAVDPGSQDRWVSPPEQAQLPLADAALVAHVNHEEPASAPAMMMSMPTAEPSNAPAENSGPSMAMPMMGMPVPGSDPAAQDTAAREMALPSMAMPAMSMPGEPAMNEQPTVVVEAPAMQEIQFDQGPSVEFQAQQDAALPPAASPQGFVGDYGSNNVNSLRDPAPQDQPLRASPGFNPPVQDVSAYDPTAYEAPAYGNAEPPYNEPAYSAPEPVGYPEARGYPQPQGMTGDQSMVGQSSLPNLPRPAETSGYESGPEYGAAPNYGDQSSRRGTPTRFAGHQRGGQAPMGTPNQLGMPSQQFGGAAQNNAYLENQNDPIAGSLPGDRRLEGVQTPSVVIHKRAPAEVKVGKAATFVIQVRNVGTAEALGVQVHDRVPAGMQLVDATPAPQMQGDTLVWQLGSMPVGDERAITMQLIPREEGELGSVARVTFEAAASVRTRSTRPELRIVQQAPQKVLIGQQLEIELEISNIGTGEATGVILQEDVPQGLDHPRGRQLDNALGNLRPGETRREILRLRAAEPGMIQNVVRLTSEDAEEVSHSVNVEVVAPVMNVQLTGPSRRFLERQATYMVDIANSGTAPATNVEVIAYLDRGFTFVSTENNGHYDSNRHAVLWSIVNLPPGDSGSVPLTLMPIEAGEQTIRLEAVADLDTRSQSESTVSVESQAELTFSIADTADPIELGAETTYEIRVQNAGSRNDTNIQVRLQVPPGIELLESDADVQTDGRGGIMFAPHKNLLAGGDLVYRVRVRGVQADTHVIQAIVTSDQSRVPVTKEESTMVYADR